ncbi:MAG TPA: purine-nucleoside phosphorylase [Acidimicrobiales bacterium]|nr:purine-nucleoside phosphorylase [Acidimicrobiales bacterium]
MPTTTPGARGTDPFEQARLAARELTRHTTFDHHDVLVVLGTGLTPVASMLGAGDRPIDLTALPWSSRFTGVGHRPEAWSLDVSGKRTLIVAGRLHLYEGRTPAEVVHVVRTALATGCRTAVFTSSVGGINPSLRPGQVVAVSDHLNLTGTSPLTGIPADHPAGLPYVDLADAWSPQIRALARAVDPGLAEGVYAQVSGPQLETPAEVRMLAGLGADLVGMSMVPEAIAARHLGAEVLGLAVVTNTATGLEPATPPSTEAAAAGAGEEPGSLVEGILKTATEAAGEVARLVGGVIARLEDGAPPDD